MINFVSNLPQNLRSGGFSAMNFAAWSGLATCHSINYIGPVNPPASHTRKLVSKLLQIAGRQSDYYFFCQSRLQSIAKEVEEKCAHTAKLDFFHGFTPWISTQPERPYVAWSDCTFRDYIQFFHNRARFREVDLRRIEAAEAAWMKGARLVMFTSKWAAANAQVAYGLDTDKVGVIGVFGDLVPPVRDEYAGAPQFTFISTNFIAKGGMVVLEAFRRLRSQYPDIELTVVGDRGPLDLSEPQVKYVGFLRKEEPTEYAKLREIFATSRAIVNASKSDTASVLLVEAGYFGCPSISSRRFATPEIIEDGVGGILLDEPEDPNSVAQAMAQLLVDEDGYAAMRLAAWNKSRRDHSKEQFEKRLLHYVAKALTAVDRC